MILLFWISFILNFYGTYFSRKYKICGILNIFCHSFLKQSNNSKKYIFRSTTAFADTKFPLPQHRYHWKTEKYWGSADCGEVYLDSNVNLLAAGKLRQSTTVPSQCEWLTQPWTWHILYFNCLSHFENIPSIV